MGVFALVTGALKDSVNLLNPGVIDTEEIAGGGRKMHVNAADWNDGGDIPALFTAYMVILMGTLFGKLYMVRGLESPLTSYNTVGESMLNVYLYWMMGFPLVVTVPKLM